MPIRPYDASHALMMIPYSYRHAPDVASHSKREVVYARLPLGFLSPMSVMVSPVFAVS
jgi:hypothetical protein